MSSKKKLLIVTPYMPYPLNGGGQIAQFEINDSIRHSLDITIIFPVKPENIGYYKALTEKWPDIIFEPYFPTKYEHARLLFFKTLNHGFYFRLRIWLSYLLKGKNNSNDISVIKSSIVYKSDTIDHGLLKQVLKQTTEKKFDIVQIEFSDLLPLINFLPKDFKRIFVHHELRFARDYSELNILSNLHPLLKKLWNRNKVAEINNLKQYDLIIALSDHDKAKLAPYLENEKILVSPFVIRPRSKNIQPFTFKNKLVFIGGQAHFPNYDGLHWFVSNCWKELRKKLPDLQLHIVGKWDLQPDSWLQEFEDIHFLGYVDDLEKACQNGISIVPIRIGSGIRMKIIETINIGIPFVTTTIGVEGLNFQDGLDCLLADTPEEFISSLTKIISSQSLGRQLSEHAKLTLESEYSYENIIRRRLAAYNI